MAAKLKSRILTHLLGVIIDGVIISEGEVEMMLHRNRR